MAQKKQILVVEDSLINRELLAEILSEQYAVLQAENGREALDILEQNRSGIALILLDIVMPVMDGYTFLDIVRKDAELSLIPVIVTTQSSNEADEIDALAHGATDFVPKPYRPAVIRHRVSSLINLRETAALMNQFQYDRLTGLYSKEYFYQRVREQLQAEPEQEYSIICSNIENFKIFNDAFGTQTGDRLLKEIAMLTQRGVSSTGLCARYGADRFLCLQTRQKEQEDRRNFVGLANVKLPPIMENIVMRWGIYEITDRSIPVEQMCDRAMLAVDSIAGKYNQFFAVYDENLRSKLLREGAITDAMETVLAENQFVVYLQPKYSLNDECMVGAEALVRWNHPEWGFVSPGEFIPLFEKNGFIFRLDRYIWEQVCILLRDWRRKGYASVSVSVNVSRADLYQARLAETLLELTRKYEIDPTYLHLEITESAYAENPRQIISMVETLRKQGFIIEMDDFGSGYSSLNMLSQMKLDVLKLDMKFIQNEIAKPVNRSIINDIINMAHRMNLSVVAEGVETREQVKRLQAMRCDYVQGYFFAKPMPAAEFEKMWSAQCERIVPPDLNMRRSEIGKHRLLLVDDDAAFREKVRRMFEKHYLLVEAQGADEALDCLWEYGHGGVAAVILSTTLPGNNSERVMKALRKEPEFWNIPVLATLPSGEYTEALPLAAEADDFLCKCHPLFDLERRILRLIDSGAYQKREVSLQDEACRDYLTGLLNRRGFDVALDTLHTDDLPLAVCLFDLDDLRKINDTFGHDLGDRIIRSFADLLRRRTRAEDIRCRFGEDEFVVVLMHLKNAEDALKKGMEICRLFNECYADEQLTVSCSGGVALSGLSGKTFDQMIGRATEALHRAKQTNRGGCCLWEAAVK